MENLKKAKNLSHGSRVVITLKENNHNIFKKELKINKEEDKKIKSHYKKMVPKNIKERTINTIGKISKIIIPWNMRNNMIKNKLLIIKKKN